MKKSGAFVLLVVVFLFVQCTPEDGAENSDCVNVTLGGDVMMPDTRISMDVNGDLTWNDDDRIYMLDGCNEKPVKLSVKNVSTNGPKKRSYYCELYRYFGVADYIERVIYHQGRTTPTSKFLGRNYYYQSGELSMLKNNITAKAKIMACKNNSNDYEFMHNVTLSIMVSVLYIDFTGHGSENYHINYEGCANVIEINAVDEYVKEYEADPGKTIDVVEYEEKYTLGEVTVTNNPGVSYVVILPQQEPRPNTVMEITNGAKELVGRVVFPNGIRANKLYVGSDGGPIRISKRSVVVEKDLSDNLEELF